MQTEIKTIECRAGLTEVGGQRGFFIVSPRTSRRVELPAPRMIGVNHRLPGRIAQAASRGRLRVAFTSAELKGIAEAVAAEDPARTARPPAPNRLTEWCRRPRNNRVAGQRRIPAVRVAPVAGLNREPFPMLPAMHEGLPPWYRVQVKLRVVRADYNPHRWLVERVECARGADRAERPWRVWITNEDGTTNYSGYLTDATFSLKPEAYAAIRKILI